MSQPPPPPPPFSGMPPLPPPMPAPVPANPTGGLIPVNNPKALTSYYLGLFSIIPALGLLLAFAALPLGIAGLKLYKMNPAVRGRTHAWVGVVFSSISLLMHGFILLAIVAARYRSGRGY